MPRGGRAPPTRPGSATTTEVVCRVSGPIGRRSAVRDRNEFALLHHLDKVAPHRPLTNLTSAAAKESERARISLTTVSTSVRVRPLLDPPTPPLLSVSFTALRSSSFPIMLAMTGGTGTNAVNCSPSSKAGSISPCKASGTCRGSSSRSPSAGHARTDGRHRLKSIKQGSPPAQLLAEQVLVLLSSTAFRVHNIQTIKKPYVDVGVQKSPNECSFRATRIATCTRNRSPHQRRGLRARRGMRREQRATTSAPRRAGSPCRASSA